MNPVILAALARSLPSMFAVLAAARSVEQMTTLAAAATQANQAIKATQLLGNVVKFVGFVPFRAVGGALNGILGPAIKLIPGQRNQIEQGLIMKIIQKEGEMMTIVTGPDFAMFILYNTAKVVVAIVVFMVVKRTVQALVTHVIQFMEYKHITSNKQDNDNINNTSRNYLN